MTLLSFDPTATLLRLQESLDRLAREPALGVSTFGTPGLTVFPPINVFTDDDALVVRAEVPGFREDDLSVTVEARRLTVEGERSENDDPAGTGSYHRRERQFGRFSRTLPLPENLDTEAATATCRNGLLTIRIPRRAGSRRRQIRVAHA